ncbi:glycosyltransferase family 2 protein [Superficieibacter sp. HKU1]|uniref:glycosyltransferase family 2 protein n=1 Tax=Superficieibacter sp. HKU1 TaxID=3031919 RepID=UPI0023E16555|nr:glycosyltransferase family 2 protein [Superficieibacter sp. HKU1]WES66723.1 glycosyltransferase family 2 protein [Superficieibacter sp. HKU1]
MENSVLVSIITPTYNSQSFILQTYNSLINQSHQKWEWLVTDDCSTDETWAILDQIKEKDQRVKVFKNERNRGAAYSRNNSLANAQGSFIAFIDSDDLWEKDKLETQLKFMLENEYKFTFTSYDLISELGTTINKQIDIRENSLEICYEDLLLKKVTLGCSTVMLDASYHKNVKMPLLRTGQDYALWLKLLKENDNKAHLLPVILSHYRIVKGSISRNKFKKAMRQWQIYRQIERINLIKASWCFVNYAWRTVAR